MTRAQFLMWSGLKFVVTFILMRYVGEMETDHAIIIATLIPIWGAVVDINFKKTS
jgi:hypothetical protein